LKTIKAKQVLSSEFETVLFFSPKLLTDLILAK